MCVSVTHHIEAQEDSTSTENITTLFKEAKILENQSKLDLALIVLNKPSKVLDSIAIYI